MKMIPFQQFKKELLRDKAARKAFDELEPEFALAEAIIQKRIQRGMTQTRLAKKIGTKQSAIARLESGTYNPTFGMLRKVAKALDGKLKISIS